MNRDQNESQTTRYSRYRLWTMALGGVLALIVAGLGVRWAFWPSKPNGQDLRSRMRLTDSWPNSPWTNTQREIKYVGDVACDRCHAEITASYRQHPMGRSMASVAGKAPTGGTAFEVGSSRFTVENRDGRTFHKESQRDDQGKIVAEVEAEVSHAVGSGERAISYLLEHDGRLFQSPITWYARKNQWGLSPSYDRMNNHFDRPIVPQCLFCHANRVEPVALTLNKYETPIFQTGHAIGCERCHGPGELHVQGQNVVDGRDLTIVNPKRLTPILREAVCEQCHLLGDQRVERAGRQTFDYRPGLPLTAFVAIFERRREGDRKFGGHVEQMHASRCFRESDGRFGCVSCHNPHKVPAAEERVAYFRGKCLTCHEQKGCSLPTAERTARIPNDSCIQCHMPGFSKTEITHIATTDHRILRDPGADPQKPRGVVSSGAPLVLFHADTLDADELAATDRELGIALTLEGQMIVDARLRTNIGATAQPFLEQALSVWPDDSVAGLALARSLRLQGRQNEALLGYEQVLKISLHDESALDESSSLALDLGKRQIATKNANQAARLNPWSSGLREQLAKILSLDQTWEEAAGEASEALRLNPFRTVARMILIQSHIQRADTVHAKAEFETLKALNPSEQTSLQSWFDQQRAASPRR